jgi:hypothetical protein
VFVGEWGVFKVVGPRVSQGRGGASTVQDRAVDLQHGTRVDENLPGHQRPLHVGFLHFETYSLIIIYCKILYKYCIFFSFAVKNKPPEGVMNVRLFLGLLAWL